MAEPASIGIATLAIAAASVPALNVFGVHLGLRPDVLFAGFSGSLVAIALLNSVPVSGDTWSELLRTTLRRAFVALASSATAGYLVPVLSEHAAASTTLASAFLVGAAAQKILVVSLAKFSGKRGSAE